MESAKIERISPHATRSFHSDVLLVDQALLKNKTQDASKSPRRRAIHVLHAGDADSLQRMLNAIQPGSYVRPHRHATPPQAETLVILQGSLGCVCFDDDGNPRESDFLVLDARRGAFAVDTRADVWHTIFALEPDTVVLEAKPGPYDPGSDKGFAPWAPAEDSPEGIAYLIRLEDRLRQVCGLPARGWDGMERP